MDKRRARTSKFLSLVLRHQPSAANVELDAGGWVSVTDLIEGMTSVGRAVSLDELEAVVAANDKHRFVIRQGRIRAAQGHSLPVDLGLERATPPSVLYHGTAVASLAAVMKEGLRPMSRQFVHLSSDRETAKKVGGRHGRPVVLRVDAAGMHERNLALYLSENGVWLSDHVPPEYLSELGPGVGDTSP